MLLLNEPAPLPLVVQVSALVGVPVVFQQMPRAVVASDPPPWVMLPPPCALVAVMLVMTDVVTEGSTGTVKVASVAHAPPA